MNKVAESRKQELLAQVLSGELDLDEASAIMHAEAYPNGCMIEGHRCESCHKRLGEPIHKVKCYKSGGRAGYYLPRHTYVCTVPGCSYASSNGVAR